MAAYRSNYPKQNIKRFLNIISLAFSAGVWFVLITEKNEQRTGNVFDPKSYNRKRAYLRYG
jgi:hypothetical protein